MLRVYVPAESSRHPLPPHTYPQRIQNIVKLSLFLICTRFLLNRKFFVFDARQLRVHQFRAVKEKAPPRALNYINFTRTYWNKLLENRQDAMQNSERIPLPYRLLKFYGLANFITSVIKTYDSFVTNMKIAFAVCNFVINSIWCNSKTTVYKRAATFTQKTYAIYTAGWRRAMDVDSQTWKALTRTKDIIYGTSKKYHDRKMGTSRYNQTINDDLIWSTSNFSFDLLYIVGRFLFTW